MLTSMIFAKSLAHVYAFNFHSAFGHCPLRRATLAPQRQQSTTANTRMGQYSMDMSFRTEINIPPWPEHNRMGYSDSFFLLGSCFSENIGDKLSRAKLQTAVNPSHGLLFSPLSAAESLDRMISGVSYTEGEGGVVFSEAKGLWTSLDHHSAHSSTSR